MRTIPTAELDLWRDQGAREYRVRVRRPGEVAWTQVEGYAVGVSVDGETPDQPSTRFTLRLLKRDSLLGELSPGISAAPLNTDAASAYRPAIHPGRSVEVDCRIRGGAYPWRLWLQGEVEDVEWPGEDVVATCATLDAVIEAAQIEAVEEAGAPDPGVPLATYIQGQLTRWMGATAPSLLTVGDPEWGVGERKPSLGSLGAHLLEEARRPAWDLRYRWSEADQNYRYTLYLPPRDKTTPDLTLGVDEVFAVPGLKESRQYVRNAFPITYKGGATVTVLDANSIAEYRRQAMPITDPELTVAQATALGEYAKSDLSRPLADGRYEIAFLPWIELHDVLVIQADGDHFDFDTQWAVVGVSHRVEAEGGAWTTLDLRGGTPVGAFYAWHRRTQKQAADTFRVDVAASENGTTGTLQLIVSDPARVDHVEFTATAGDGTVTTGLAPNRTPSTGVYERDILLDAEHNVMLSADVILTDGTSRPVAPVTFDRDQSANILGLPQVSYDDDVATVQVRADSDTASLWWQESADAGANWGAESQIAAGREGSFTVTASPSAKRLFRVYGKTSGGVAGPSVRVWVDRYVAPGGGGAAETVDIQVLSAEWQMVGAKAQLAVTVLTGTLTSRIDVHYLYASTPGGQQDTAADYSVAIAVPGDVVTLLIEDAGGLIHQWTAADATPTIELTPYDAAAGGTAGTMRTATPEPLSTTGAVGVRASRGSTTIQADRLVVSSTSPISLSADGAGRPLLDLSTIPATRGGTGYGTVLSGTYLKGNGVGGYDRLSQLPWADLADVPETASRWPTPAEIGAAPVVHQHTMADLSGILDVARGGTGADLSAAAAGQVLYMGAGGNLAATAGGLDGQVLTKNGSFASWSTLSGVLPNGTRSNAPLLHSGTSGNGSSWAPYSLPGTGAPSAGMALIASSTSAVAWTSIPYPVTSVAGKTGAVTLTAADVGALSQSSADSQYLQLSGGALTGLLSFPVVASAGNEIADFGRGYSLWCDNTGSGGVSRLWFDAPDGGEIVFGGRASGNVLDRMRVRGHLTLEGSMGCTSDITATTFYKSSSRALKEHIRPLDFDPWTAIDRLAAVRGRYRGETWEDVFFIAEDTDPLFLSSEGLQVDVARVATVLVADAQAAHRRIEALEAELATLRARMD